MIMIIKWQNGVKTVIDNCIANFVTRQTSHIDVIENIAF